MAAIPPIVIAGVSALGLWLMNKAEEKAEKAVSNLKNKKRKRKK